MEGFIQTMESGAGVTIFSMFILTLGVIICISLINRQK